MTTAKTASADHLPNSAGCFQLAPLPHTAAAGGPTWTPLKPGDLPQPVLRPGALDHTKYGSRQPDGSVRPFKPIGYLSSSVRTDFAYREKFYLPPR